MKRKRENFRTSRMGLYQIQGGIEGCSKNKKKKKKKNKKKKKKSRDGGKRGDNFNKAASEAELFA